MGKVPQPDSLAAQLSAMDKRLSALESTQRLLINRLRSANLNAAAPSDTVVGTWSSGPAGAAWTGSDGSTGTGYPKVTITSPGSLCFVLVTGAWELIGTPTVGGYQTDSAELGVSVNGSTPGLPLYLPTSMDVGAFGTLLAPSPFVISALVVTTPGTSSVFQMQGRFTAPNGTQPIKPSMASGGLIVIPMN